MTVKEFIERAEKGRRALIVSAELEAFAKAHGEEIRREVSKDYYCAGILVRVTEPGVGIHVTWSNRIASILQNGMQPSEDPLNTFGDGVIYVAPNMEAFSDFGPDFCIFRCWYGVGALRAVVTYDREEEAQGEIIIPPEALLHTEFVCYGDIRRIQHMLDNVEK